MSAAEIRRLVREFERAGDFSLEAHQELEEEIEGYVDIHGASSSPDVNPHATYSSESTGPYLCCFECGFLYDDDWDPEEEDDDPPVDRAPCRFTTDGDGGLSWLLGEEDS